MSLNPIRKFWASLWHWWHKPSKRNRILNALTREWTYGIDIQCRTDIDPVTFYILVSDLEAEGLVESQWDKEPPSESRGGYRNKIYRLKGQSDE